MPLKNLSKGRFLTALQCPLFAWMLRHDQIQAIPEDAYFNQFIAQQGHIVGDIATEWFDVFLLNNDRPRGVNIDDQLAAQGITRENPELWLSTALGLTQRAINNPNVWAIYEATFMVGSFVTRADILARTRENFWNMIEVKSISEKRDRDYVKDMAYTTSVLRNAGIFVEHVGLMRIDSNYTLDNEEQLESIDSLLGMLDIVWNLQSEVESTINMFNQPWTPSGLNTWQMADRVTSTPNPPAANFFPTCKNCPACKPVFQNLPGFPINYLPNIGQAPKIYNELQNMNITLVEQIPSGFFSGTSGIEKSAAVITESTKKKNVFVDPKLQRLLSTEYISWPVLYLDFETISTAVPLYEDTHPYEQIPVQYSIHRAWPGEQLAPGIYLPDIETLAHREFLCDPAQDERTEMAKALLEDLNILSLENPESTIFAYYASVEQRCINYLVNVLDENGDPDADALLNHNSRIQDMYRLVKGDSQIGAPRAPFVYHPDFKGSFGLKAVINSFYPDLYSSLDIASGDAATAAYARLVYAWRTSFSPWAVEELDQAEVMSALRSYCELDTYSCALLHQQLVSLVVNSGETLSPFNISYRKPGTILCPDCNKMIRANDRGHKLLGCIAA